MQHASAILDLDMTAISKSNDFSGTIQIVRSTANNLLEALDELGDWDDSREADVLADAKRLLNSMQMLVMDEGCRRASKKASTEHKLLQSELV